MTTPAWYVEYLQTEHWRLIRAIALYWAGYRCQVCNGTNHLEGHHRTYERLDCERPSDVTILCADCHTLFHGRLPPTPETDPRDPQDLPELKRPRRVGSDWDE